MGLTVAGVATVWLWEAWRSAEYMEIAVKKFA